MTDDEIKVTDKRMFTPEGELKDEYQHLEPTSTDTSAAANASTGAGPAIEQEVVKAPDPRETPTAEEPEKSRAETPPAPDLPEDVGFFDLVSLVAQPIAIYLGDAKLPDGESAENLDLARLHIDLLEVLKTKTNGNLTEQERSFLEDLLYQLRLRYVQKAR